ncbi:Multifunctional non-homologous end joining protein LigD [Mycobacterium talmoniae]|uniref:Multifunctional non-homologous end joining protein LigD n=1 Tax=Mycobacterium talmoniae TaxID=1858794 RepID=A0A2S8BJ51_9MYCO|nr:Multifunctional non-homologous end joining protein LigD [Mycobacterium talmoniae]
MSIKVEVTHPDRVLFPTDGITKGDLVDYYAEVAPVMLPHLKGRPLTLTRFPGGIDEEGFVQQNFAASLPDWMKRADVAKKGKKGATVVHPVAQRREALVWAANQDCITPHMWLSRQPRLHNPDRWCSTWTPPTASSRCCGRRPAPWPTSSTTWAWRRTCRPRVRGGCTW